jgi:hypothetical protein
MCHKVIVSCDCNYLRHTVHYPRNLNLTRQAATRQAARRDRQLLRLRARQDARLLRAGLAGMAAHVAHRRDERVAAAAAARHHARACLRRVVTAWRRQVAAGTALRQLSMQDTRRRIASAVETWRLTAAKSARLRMAEERAEAVLQRRRLRAARGVLAAWRLRVAQAQGKAAQVRAAEVLRRCEGAEERAAELAIELAAAEERHAEWAVAREARPKVCGAISASPLVGRCDPCIFTMPFKRNVHECRNQLFKL